MKVVHINADACWRGGASIAMLRLHRELRRRGIDSIIACWNKPEETYAYQLTIPFIYILLRFLTKCIFRFFWRSSPSTGLIPSGMADFVNKFKPDIVILHWLQLDTMSIAEIKKIKSPIFWYFHDLWPIRGLTAHAWYKVPLGLKWLDRVCEWNKKHIIQQMRDRIYPVCASDWVAKEIRKSSVFAGIEPTIIPLLVDSCFTIGSHKMTKRFRILNGSSFGLVAGLKGGDRLISVFRLLSEEEKGRMELVIFGADGEPQDIEGVHVSYLGFLKGDALALAYRDADVFVFPSRQETYGQTKLEALACGTPVIAFNETACAEGIMHKKNGWVACPDDIPGYVDGIRFFFNAWKDGRPIRIMQSDMSNNQVIERWKQSFAKVRKGDETL